MSKTETAVWNRIFVEDFQAPPPTLLTTSLEFLMAKQWQEELKALTQLEQLETNWDGEGAEAPDAEIIASGVALFIELSSQGMEAPTRIQPTPEGGIVVEWGSPNDYLEVEIAEPFRGEVMAVEGDAPARHWSIDWKRTGYASQPRAEWSIEHDFSYDEPAITWNRAATA